MTRQELARPPLNVGEAMREQEERMARLYRSLARRGETDMLDAIFGDEVPRLLRGDAPRLKAVA